MTSTSPAATFSFGKGDKQVVLPIGFDDLKRDVETYAIGRAPDEYLLYPKARRTDPMSGAAVHRWFKRCLERAGLPQTIKLHERRHSATDHLWRQTGNLMLAQQPLRHESVATTQLYLHPSRDDLSAALKALGDSRHVLRSDAGRLGLRWGLA